MEVMPSTFLCSGTVSCCAGQFLRSLHHGSKKRMLSWSASAMPLGDCPLQKQVR